MENQRFQWLSNARIYQVLIDRFSGHREQYNDIELRKGFLYGNIKSLMSKLDYIQSLNFNVIWLSPFFVNQINGYHGYHVVNFNHVDPRFAFGETREDDEIGDSLNENDLSITTKSDQLLKEFIEECHKRGIKIMMDFVPNHVHETHPFFVTARKEGVISKYFKWFYFKKKKIRWPPQSKFSGKEMENNQKQEVEEYKKENYNYLKFWFVDELPKWNLENEECSEYITKVTKHWLSYGIDAIRMDHCIGPTKEWVKTFVDNIHKDYPNVPIIGECLPLGCTKSCETVLGWKKPEWATLDTAVKLDFLNALDKVFQSYIGVLDGLLDFSFMYAVDYYVNGSFNESELNEYLNKHYKLFENKDFLLLKQLDSHDCDRIFFRCNNDKWKLKKAMDLLYKQYNNRTDPLVLYYGTEDFMTQEKTFRDGESYGDFRCRQPMQFGLQWMKTFFKLKNE